MLRKEEILSRTNNGLLVFKHYLPGDWRIGRHFLNPLYQDKKASCNIYFDRHSGMYKMKDFGNDNYSGDCFFFVGQLKELDCNRATRLRGNTGNHRPGFGLGAGFRHSGFPFPGNHPPGSAGQTRRNTRKASQALPVPGTEVSACRTGVLATVRHHARTAGTLQGLLAPRIQQRNGRGQTVHLHFIDGRTHVRLQGKQHIKLYRPFSTPRFLYGGSFGENYCFGLEQLPAKGDTLFITGGEKMCFRWRHTVFTLSASIAKR